MIDHQHARSGGARPGAAAPGKPITDLLDQRFGDGSIYLVDPEDRALLARARAAGLVDEAGHLTARGFLLWAIADAGRAHLPGADAAWGRIAADPRAMAA